MKSMLKILYVTPEVTPFAHTGELGEVSSAFPKHLKSLGHDVRVMMPNYKSINERKYVLRDVIRLQGLKVGVGDAEHNANGKSAFIPDSKVQIYFLDNKDYFDRTGLYSDEKTKKEFKDNAERFFFFSKGCLETLKLLYWQPQVIHCNDWQTAFIPILLKTVYLDDPFFKNTKTLFSIHNFYGTFNVNNSLFQKSGITGGINKGGNFDLLNAALEHADMLNTVGEAYAIEAQQGKNGFAKILRERKNELISIPHGIDNQIWNPETDKLIPSKYTRRDLSGKSQNKQELLSRFGLIADARTPVLGVVSQLSSEKEAELIIEIVNQLMVMDVCLIISFSGEQSYYKKLKSIQKKFQKKLGLELGSDISLNHLIIAGSDIILMPSKFEPRGLNQLYSLAYGAIPIAMKIAGFAETIEEFNPDNLSGTGFFFERFDSKAFLKAIKKAITLFNDSEKWSKLVQNAMKQDFSWKSPGQEYIKLYQKLIGSKR